MKPSLRNILLCVLMLAASGMAIALRPQTKIADQGPKLDLQSIIPKRFGDWREELISSAQVVDPQQSELVRKIYSQTLSRTYVDTQGYRIMLSIAYGNDQSDSMQVHLPEVCYPAQGFLLEKKELGTVKIQSGSLPVTRIQTSLGQRREPVTYWTTIGNKTVQNSVHKKLVEMSYGLTGKIPDGMLIRISSIDPDTAHAYLAQEQFITQMLDGVSTETRIRLAGSQNTPN